MATGTNLLPWGNAIGLALVVVGPAHTQTLTDENFAEVQKLIKPQASESLWRHIPWETNLNKARRKAAQAGKPLLIWAGGGSAPLGGC